MSIVICFRCLNGYDPDKVKKIRTKRLRVKEPACPRCKCKLYLNRTDLQPLNVKFEAEQFTAMEEE